MEKSEIVELFNKNQVFWTDGSCSCNPGPGGFGVISLKVEELDNGKIRKYINYAYSEECEHTTNNREELKAILHVYKYFAPEKQSDETVVIFTDSGYCYNLINSWIWIWCENDWRKSSTNKVVDNVDLIKELFKYLCKFPNIEVHKVKGHKDILENELADALATGNKTKFLNLCKKNNIEDF